MMQFIKIKFPILIISYQWSFSVLHSDFIYIFNISQSKSLVNKNVFRRAVTVRADTASRVPTMKNPAGCNLPLSPASARDYRLLTTDY